MAAKSGGLIDGVVDPQSADLGAHFELDRSPYTITASVLDLIDTGAKTDTQPITERASALPGGRQRGFEQDYYNRLHVSTRAIDLGNVISQQTHTVSVWNAYFEAKTLDNVAASGVYEGISLTYPRPLPIEFRALEELSFQYLVSTDGSPIIDALYTFDFDGAVDDFTVAITGSRIIPWLFEPDGEILERLEWMTNVITSYNGNEQRVRVRQTPRRLFEWDFLLAGEDRQAAENMLFGWHARPFAIPVWNDGAALTGSLSAGALSVTVDTTYRDYHADGLAILMTDPYTFEVLNIDSVSAGSLTLARAVESNWPAGTKIYPVRMARLPDSQPLRRFTGAAAYGRLRWQCTDISDYTAATETTYRGYPVLDEAPNWVEDITQEYVRKLAWMDNLAGKVTIDDEAGLPIFVQSHRWLLDGRAEIDEFRQWLYARKGRLTAFWLPSWSDDLTLQATVGPLAVNIDVEHCQYVKQVNGAIGRRDIRIELIDGTVFYRRIVAASELDADTERLQVDSAFGQTINPGDIRMISFMALVRLEADAVELRWWTWEHAEAALTVRGMTNDV